VDTARREKKDEGHLCCSFRERTGRMTVCGQILAIGN